MALGGAMVAGSAAVRAQQAQPMRRIGVLMSVAASDGEAQGRVDAFEQALNAFGWRDDENIRINLRWTAGDADRARRYAKELVALRPDVVVAVSTPVTRAALETTRTIPIVFLAGDPVGSGFVASWAHPGGNATGIANFLPSMSAKWVQMLKMIAPHVARIGYLVNLETMLSPAYYSGLKNAARTLAVDAIELDVRAASEIDQALGKLAREPNSGLIVYPDIFSIRNREPIIQLAARHHFPAVYPYSFFAKEGGLLSFGVDLAGEYRQAAWYVSKILNGSKPGELAVEHPKTYEVAINIRTADALGLRVPRTLLTIANELIQ